MNIGEQFTAIMDRLDKIEARGGQAPPVVGTLPESQARRPLPAAAGAAPPQSVPERESADGLSLEEAAAVNRYLELLKTDSQAAGAFWERNKVVLEQATEALGSNERRRAQSQLEASNGLRGGLSSQQEIALTRYQQLLKTDSEQAGRFWEKNSTLLESCLE